MICTPNINKAKLIWNLLAGLLKVFEWLSSKISDAVLLPNKKVKFYGYLIHAWQYFRALQLDGIIASKQIERVSEMFTNMKRDTFKPALNICINVSQK